MLSTIIIYLKGILISENVSEFIAKKDSHSIENNEVRPDRIPISSYYAVLHLKDYSQKQLNILFNSLINKHYAQIIKSYLDWTLENAHER